jgi:polynucleotide 5'-hydroxyl-kinase GRC3/NOL9
MLPRRKLQIAANLLIKRISWTSTKARPMIISRTQRYSRSVGLALVRGIDIMKGELHLLTPLPLEMISGILEKGRRIVLVSGRLDPPTWAYTEDLYNRSYASTAQEIDGKESAQVTDEDSGEDASEEEDMTEVSQPRSEIPWVETLHGNQKRAVGSRVWRVRRDLGKSGNATE